MTTTGYTKNFVVKNGITTGPITLDASTGNIIGTNLSVTGLTELGNIGNVKITGGTSGQAIVTDGAGNLSFANASASSSPAPMPTYVAVGDDLLISANYQGLFGYPITIDGTMTVDGVLIDVNDNGNGGGGGTATALNANIANVSISGGTSGYYLQTDGAGTLSWAAGGGGGGGSPGGVTTQVQFNDAGAFAGNTGFTFNKTTGVFTAPHLAGNGNGLSNIQGANVSGAVTYASTANSVAVANVSGIGNIATINKDGNASNVLYGNGVFAAAPGGGGGYGNSNVATFLASYGSNTITTTGNVSVGNIIGNGQSLTSITGANVTGAVSYATTANSVAGANVSGEVSYAATSNSVAGANVTGAVAYATTANGVAGANVSGQVSNALIAGTVYTNAQPNITSTGTLTSLSVSGNANVGNIGTNNFIAAGTGSFGANVNMNSQWINNVGYPNLSTDAASKEYVDTIASSGISYHQPVNVATTTTLAIATGGTTSYNSPNGAANGIGAYISTTGTFNLIDGANVQTVGTRILVKNEANATWNGVYTYANTTAIVRSTDTDEYGTDTSGTNYISINDYFFTLGGVVNKGTAFIVSAPTGTIIFGTSNIEFSTFSTSQVYDAGTGLTLTGTTFSVNASQTQVTSVGTLSSLSVSGNANIGNIGATQGVFTNVSGNGSTLSSITGANVTGAVSYATTANAVAGANVSGAVAYATTANSVAGANVSGQVSNALVAGTVYTSAQPNITSTGTLTSLSVTGNITAGGTLLPRIVSIADGTSVTINGANTDIATQTNTQVVGTLTINAPSGTPYDGQKLIFRLQSANVQTFSWNSIFAGSTDLSLPTASSGSNKYDYVGFIYNSTAIKWQLLAKNFGF